MKTIWNNIGARIWLIVTTVLVVLLLTATIIVTSVPFLNNLLNVFLGGPRERLVGGDPTAFSRYVSDYESKNATLNAANALNEKLAEDGMILLKNADNALPLRTPSSSASVTAAPKISVFGKNSVNLVYGGSGSSATGNITDGAATLYTSLELAGYAVNPTLKAFYDDNSMSGSGRPASPAMTDILTGFPTGETEQSRYTQVVKDSFSEYSDAAIVVISRIGGEGYDLPRSMRWNGKDYTSWSGTDKIPGARSAEDHYLQLDQNETDMLKLAADNFSKVIVVMNCSQSFELGFLDDPNHYAYQENIKAAVWIGSTGRTGINALGKILNGAVTPSGHTVDTYARDFKNDPSWKNFGNNITENGNMYSGTSDGYSVYFVDYEESIYVGYRYYETRAFTDGDKWYKDNVVYPFGHGLSYTTFDWEITDWSIADNATIAKDGSVKIKVKVTNTGDAAGKDVVQLYYSAPYESGKIEKSHVVLGDFAKTPLLYPAADANETDKPNSYTVELNLTTESLASYDYSDANNNGTKAYELDGGSYKLLIGKDAHQAWSDNELIRTVNVPNGGYAYTEDVEVTSRDGNKTLKAAENRFDDVSEHIATYLSRSDWNGTWPSTPSAEDRASMPASFYEKLKFRVDDDESDPWYETKMPRQSAKSLTSEEATVKLYDLIGKPYDDELWDTLLNQLTLKEMAEMIGTGAYKTLQIESIDKPLTIDPDGPPGFVIFMTAGDSAVYDTCYYVSECVIAATWNKELAFEMGKMIGNEGIWGNVRGDGRPYSGWYAPAMNIHRSPFGGRNWEYYSEDGYLSGAIGAEVVKGTQSKGVYAYLKHFALNDQETNRDNHGLVTWASEQAMRELYFKPFERCVKDGGARAVMSSFNRIGTTWAGGSYELLTEVLRNEWGFRGMVITDFNLKPQYMPADQMIRAGGDLNLTHGGADYQPTTATSARTATQISCMRSATKNILYTVANSNAMNGRGGGVVYEYLLPIWQIVLISVDVAIAVGLGVWGFFAVRKALKRAKLNN